MKGAEEMPWYGSHPYLNEYIREYKCRKIMEVGVYSGENAVKMVETAVENIEPSEVEYFGFDFFSYYTTSDISLKLEKTGCKYKLFEGNTVDTIPQAIGSLPQMGLIFIDGGKSFEVAMSDWKNSQVLMHEETGVFVHNADFSGVSKMVDNISRKVYRVEFFYAPTEGKVALIKRI
jgi:hypothetical protein